MKLQLSVLILVFSIICQNKLSSQLDTFKRHEIRVSTFGNSYFRPNFDSRITNRDQFLDPTITYLHHITNSKYYIKVDASGFYQPGFQTITTGDINKLNAANGKFAFANLYLGVERQHQFKHWGLFLGLGARGGFTDYQSDIIFNDETVNDFQTSEKYIGLAAQVTAYTNFTDKVYLFITATNYSHYTNVQYNQQYNDDCCNDYRGFDTNLHIIDAVGMGFRF